VFPMWSPKIFPIPPPPHLDNKLWVKSWTTLSYSSRRSAEGRSIFIILSWVGGEWVPTYVSGSVQCCKILRNFVMCQSKWFHWTTRMKLTKAHFTLWIISNVQPKSSIPIGAKVEKNRSQGLYTRSQGWNRKKLNLFNLPQITNKCWNFMALYQPPRLEKKGRPKESTCCLL
jgi:hypothetical protein